MEAVSIWEFFTMNKIFEQIFIAEQIFLFFFKLVTRNIWSNRQMSPPTNAQIVKFWSKLRSGYHFEIEYQPFYILKTSTKFGVDAQTP